MVILPRISVVTFPRIPEALYKTQKARESVGEAIAVLTELLKQRPSASIEKDLFSCRTLEAQIV